MNLFEKIQNKRYDLQEKKEFSKNSDGSDKNIIKPKKGEAARTKKLINQKIKDITSPKPGEADASQEVVNKFKRETNISKEAQKNLDDIGKKTKIDANTVRDFKKKISNIKKLGYDPDAPSSQLSGETKETMFRKGQSATDDEKSFRRNARRQITGDTGVNQADVSKRAKKFSKSIDAKRLKLKSEKEAKSQQRKIKKQLAPGEIGPKQKEVRPAKRRKPSKTPTQLSKDYQQKNMITVRDDKTGGFKRVEKTSKAGRRAAKNFADTSQLVDSSKNISKTKTKTNLFTKIKNFVKPKVPGDFKVTRGPGNNPTSITRKLYKGKLGGARKIIDKLPGRYKAAGLGLIATTAYLASRGKGNASPVSASTTKKKYTASDKTLFLDTGKKKT